MKNLQNNKAYLFDIDGTLTKSRKKMCNGTSMQFLSWMYNKDVFFVTGSDVDKSRQQLPHSILSRCKGIFSSMGNVYHEKNNLIYKNDFKIDEDILKNINGKLCNSQCPEKYRATKHYEFRQGMLNFSFCGRDVSNSQRKQYFEWDKKNKERQMFVEWFNKTYSKDGLEACVGGEISVDIQPIGMDKRQAVKHLQSKGYNYFVFYGDRAEPGGNDWGICEYIIENKIGSFFKVDNPNHTFKLLLK